MRSRFKEMLGPKEGWAGRREEFFHHLPILGLILKAAHPPTFFELLSSWINRVLLISECNEKITIRKQSGGSIIFLSITQHLLFGIAAPLCSVWSRLAPSVLCPNGGAEAN